MKKAGFYFCLGFFLFFFVFWYCVSLCNLCNAQYEESHQLRAGDRVKVKNVKCVTKTRGLRNCVVFIRSIWTTILLYDHNEFLVFYTFWQYFIFRITYTKTAKCYHVPFWETFSYTMCFWFTQEKVWSAFQKLRFDPVGKFISTWTNLELSEFPCPKGSVATDLFI